MLRLGFVCVFALAGCDVGRACEDTDLDGYGPGCELGEDCDADNAARNVDCSGVPPPDCDADPVATGCPCLAGGFTDCLDARAGVGVCVAGRTSCINGFWGLCEGSTGPSSERCDGVDQDCDGLVDEGVVSPCGGCNSACQGGVWGQSPVPFEEGPGLELTRFGELTLATLEERFGTLWVPNSADGTLSRVDTNEAREVARYSTLGSEPSRVAVDFLGDAWAVNREFGGVSSVVKVASAPGRCVDRDGDGVQTSEGPSEVLLDDECVVFRADVGELGGLARAIAIDGDTGLDGVSGGDAWIGLHDAEAIVELDGLTGAELTRVETPGFAPYAATFDRWGTLFMIERDGVLARIDVRADPPTVELIEVPHPCFLLYGLAADPAGRLLMTGFSCDRVFSYDPALERWDTASSFGAPRAAAPHGGRVWIAHTVGQLSEVAFDPLRIRRSLSTATTALVPVETVGVAVDALGQVWAISSRSAGGELGVATRIDPDAEAVSAQVVLGRGPHAQGDLTGARVAISLVPEASAAHAFEGCGPEVETEWLRAHLAADPGSAGEVQLEVRHASEVAALGGAPWRRLGAVPSAPSDAPAPWELDLPAGGAIELRLTLRVDARIGAPRVQRVGVEWRCPGPD